MTQTNKSSQYVPGRNLLGALAVVLLALAVRPSQAAPGDLAFTIEEPGVQESQVTCDTPTVETFDQATSGFLSGLSVPIGDYAAGSAEFEIKAADDFGGADGNGQYISTEIEESYTLTLTQPAGYFGFWWSAGNGNNRLIVNMDDGTSQTFSTQTILDSDALDDQQWNPDGGHLGNPNPNFIQTDATEYYAYVNIFAANEDAKIVSLEFLEQQGTTGAFESDNHTVCPDLIDEETGEPIPQTGSISIVKEADPQSEQEFAFLTNVGGPLTSFQLKDNGIDANTKRFDGLEPSVWDFTEQPTTGWGLESIECSGGSDITIVEESANVQIRLSGGEDVTCTFNNERTVGPGPGGPEPIPAVSLWGLGLLSLLLAAVGWSRSR